MSLATGTRLGPYEVVSAIGAGGMGEVYRARDLRLRREVALKVLPDLVAADPDRLARFAREAQLLAALSHPNIAGIHGIEDANGVRALVLELVEGPTLEDRVRQGPIEWDEALAIGQQLIDALEAAHASGIVHRDLKPSNIKLRPDGTVKVLDFGLAKALDPAQAAEVPAEAATLTSPAVTGAGMLLGTAAYMSPEQARGQTVDRRADIWAFGCVLYEMLTGRRAFKGRDVTETLAFVITKAPDWTALPSAVTPPLRRLLRRTLEKDPRRRLADIADARLEIDDARREPATETLTAAPPARRERFAWLFATMALALIALAAWAWPGRAVPDAPETRVDIVAPPTSDAPSMALSPDGRKVVFAATTEGRSQLWLRSLDDDTAEPLAGTDNARLPFWSADSRAIGFGADAQIKRIDLDSRVVRPVAHAPVFLGATWNRHDEILFVPAANNPVFRVAAAGGDPVAVTRLEAGHLTHHSPHYLPDGRRFLYYVVAAGSGTASIHAGAVGSDATHRILDADAGALYLDPGYLLFVRDTTALAQRVDPRTLATIGDPVPFARSVAAVQFAPALSAALSASAAGGVVYRRGAPERSPVQFAWRDRGGAIVEPVGEPMPVVLNPALSPAEQRLAVFGAGSTSIWILDARRGGALSRFTTTPGVDFAAIWSPDGRRLVLSSNRAEGGIYDLYLRSATGAGSDELLFASPQNKTASDWADVDGGTVLFTSLDHRRAFDIWAMPVKDGIPFPVVQTDADERNAQFSPDGRWIAYQSNETGRFEIWVQPFERIGSDRGGRWQVTTTGGVHVRWSRDGSELFYVTPDHTLMAVPIGISADGASIEFGVPERLFTVPALNFASQGTALAPYVVSRDGRRFLLAAPLAETTNTAPLTMILGWTHP